jgi:hypothetical protein
MHIYILGGNLMSFVVKIMLLVVLALSVSLLYSSRCHDLSDYLSSSNLEIQSAESQDAESGEDAEDEITEFC